VTSGSTERAGFRRKRLAIIAAGPAMNAAIFGIVAALRPTSAVLRDLAVVNAFVLIQNLLPFSQRTSLGPQPNDGLALVRTLFDPEAELEEHRAAILVAEAQLLRDRGHDDEARTLTAAAIERFPRSRIARTWVGHDLITSGRYAEAREVFASLVDDDPRRIASRPRGRDIAATAVHLNNLAWVDLMLNDPELIPEANTASARALELLPGHSAVMGTRALALITTKRFVEGVALGEKAFRKEPDRRNRALQACVLAIGHAADWRFAQAERWGAIATRLDPDCALLERARAELDTRRAAASGRAPNVAGDVAQDPGPGGR
jgi:tetratricopeptide (TPR) repeat protein